ncbi:MAG: CDP-alcohol phosphatidyltransferase family protein [Candidatus Omnitrophica bacterium]|nr:CDP-alcohol phosphatidyltransferase family protein [Candidatus Omnitrophota bacterium]
MSFSLKEIRRLGQEARRPGDTKYGIYIARPISRYITWAMLRTNISANGFTFFFLLFGLLSCGFLLHGGYGHILIGMVMFNIWYILDHVDGEMARCRKNVTLTGVYLDSMSHYIIHPVMLASIGFGLFNRTGLRAPLIWSIVCGFNLMLITVLTDLKFSILWQKFGSENSDKKELPDREREAHRDTLSVAARLFSLIHSLCTFPNVIVYLSIFAVLDFFIKGDWFYSGVIILTILSGVVWSMKTAYIVLTKQLDKEKKR